MPDNSNKYNGFNQIVKTLYNEELEAIDANLDLELKNKGNVKIEPKLIYDKFTKEMKIEFKIGNKRMYKLKNLSEFYTMMMNKEFYKYGDKLDWRIEICSITNKPALERIFKAYEPNIVMAAAQ